MLPDIQPGNTKILYFFNCLLDGMHTTVRLSGVCFNELNSSYLFSCPEPANRDNPQMLPL